MSVVFYLLANLVGLYLLLLIARLVFNWIQVFAPGWSPKGIVAVFAELIFTATDPPLRFVGRFVPPLRLGSVSLDLAFLIVMFGLFILKSVLEMLARA